MNAPDDKNSIISRYTEGPDLLERTLAGLQDTDLDIPPSNGGWTIRQIVHHIVDGDDLWKTCIKIALGNEQAEFTLEWYWAQPQDVWANRWAYAHRSLEVSLALLKANRDHIKQLLEHVPECWNRSIGFRKHNGEIERLPIGAVIEIQGNHLVHHVNRISAIREEIGGG